MLIMTQRERETHRHRHRQRERERICAKVKLVKQCCESEISETMLLSACPELMLLLAAEI